MTALERLGWHDFFQAQLTPELEPLQIARVVEEQRGLCRLAGDFDGWGEVSGRFRHQAQTAADFPAVGDWVGIVAAARGRTRHHPLPARAPEHRVAEGRGPDRGEQVLAANVDTIFLVTALAGDLNPRRLERYLTMVWEAGARRSSY